MILRVAISIVVLIGLILLFAASKPKTFRIEHSISIDAPADKIFALIDDLHNWEKWAPEDKEDSSGNEPTAGRRTARVRFANGLALEERGEHTC